MVREGSPSSTSAARGRGGPGRRGRRRRCPARRAGRPGGRPRGAPVRPGSGTSARRDSASARRSRSTSQPTRRCTGGRPLCTSDRSPHRSWTPSTSSRHHSSDASGDLDEVAVQVAGQHAVDEVRRRAGVVVLLHGVERHPLGPPPVAQVGHRRALLGDRRAVLADPPVVDDVGDHVEGAGEVGAGGRRLVLVPHALGPLQPLLAPERRAEQLVPREHVAQDLGVLAGGDARTPLAVQAAHPGRLVEPVGLPADDRAGDEVGARVGQRVGQRGERPRRQHVVGVEEGQVVAGDPLGADVAGRAEAAVGARAAPSRGRRGRRTRPRSRPTRPGIRRRPRRPGGRRRPGRAGCRGTPGASARRRRPGRRPRPAAAPAVGSSPGRASRSEAIDRHRIGFPAVSSPTTDTRGGSAPGDLEPEDYPRKVLFVAGAGRSGTSTLSGLMQLMGLHVPQPEVVPDESNPKGFGEPAWVVEHHDRLLKDAGVQVSDARPDAWFETGRVSTREPERIRTAEWLDGHFAEGNELVVKDPRLSLVPRPVAGRGDPRRRRPGVRHDAAPAVRGGRQQAEVLREPARLGPPRGQLAQHAAAHRARHPRVGGRRRPRVRPLRRPARRLGQGRDAARRAARAPERAARQERADPRRPPVRRPRTAPRHPEPGRPPAAAQAARPHRADLGRAQQAGRAGRRHHRGAHHPRPAAGGVRRPVRRGRGHLAVLGRRHRAAAEAGAEGRRRPARARPRPRSLATSPTRSRTASARPSRPAYAAACARRWDASDDGPRHRRRTAEPRGTHRLRHRLALDQARGLATRHHRGAAGEERGAVAAVGAAAAAARLRRGAARRQRLHRRHARGGGRDRRPLGARPQVPPDDLPVRRRPGRRRAPRPARAVGALARRTSTTGASPRSRPATPTSGTATWC